MYRSDNGYFPNIGTGAYTNASGLATPLVTAYLPAIPADPISTESYRYQATNISGGNYYGYCLSVKLEGEDPTDSCTPDTANSHNDGVKNP
jgi:hypothetical protein